MDNITNKLSMHVDMNNFIPATPEEKAYMVQMRESSTFFKDCLLYTSDAADD